MPSERPGQTVVPEGLRRPPPSREPLGVIGGRSCPGGWPDRPDRTAAGYTRETNTPAAYVDEDVAKDLLKPARRDGVSLVAPDGLLAGWTKTALETPLKAQLTDHLGYEKHEPVCHCGRSRHRGHVLRCRRGE